MRTTTSRHDTPTGCPPWCDPSQHITDDNDTTLIVIHRSKPVAPPALGSPRIQQTARRFGRRVVHSPVSIVLDFAGEVELQSRDEATEYLKGLNLALVGLTKNAWLAA
jgi:hypothetical protein